MRAVRAAGRVLLVVVSVATAGCAAARPAPDPRTVEECRGFAEDSTPRAPVRGNGAGRSTVHLTQDADTLRTLYDLCMQAKDALIR